MTDRQPSLAAIEKGMADLAMIIQHYGDHGLVFLPIFERLERERERKLAQINTLPARLDQAIARCNQNAS